MGDSKQIRFGGLTPYLYYDDVGAIADWLARVFGFVEKARHLGSEGKVQNVEMVVGPTELWLDGYPNRPRHPDEPPEWVGVWVDDVDAMYARVRAAAVDAEPPVDRPFGVRMLTVKDPEGISWGFIKRQ